ncbi:hypothetical protein RSAG8_04401, partial [Rhizoctonia solani AG-8 WAC10335]
MLWISQPTPDVQRPSHSLPYPSIHPQRTLPLQPVRLAIWTRPSTSIPVRSLGSTMLRSSP